MADFLTRLAERARGTAPVARPRSTPLFDPGPVAGAELPAAEAGAAPGVDPRNAEPSRAVPTPSGAPLHPAPKALIPAVSAALSSERPAAAAEESPAMEARRASEPSPRQVDAPQPPPAQPRELPAAVEAALRAAPPELVGRTSEPEPAPDRPTPSLADVAAPIPNRRTSDDASDGRPPDRRRESPPQAGPAIRVTIGRVEVRAVMSPPPQQRASRQSALMSLEDYLQRGRS